MTNINLEEIGDNVNKMGQSAYIAIKAFYAMNTNTVEQLFDQQIAMATLGMESITSQMELMSSAKDYKAVIIGQADIANAISRKSQGIVRNTMDIMNETKDGFSALVEGVAMDAANSIEKIKAA